LNTDLSVPDMIGMELAPFLRFAQDDKSVAR